LSRAEYGCTAGRSSIPRLASFRLPGCHQRRRGPIAPPYGLTSADALVPAGRIRYDAKVTDRDVHRDRSMNDKIVFNL
jgi:hypothetical protein